MVAEDIAENVAESMTETHTIAGVRFQKCGKLYHFDCSAFPTLRKSDWVVVETSRGRQLGEVMGFPKNDAGRDLKPIVRIATPQDLVMQQMWKSKEMETLVTCSEKAKELGGFDGVRWIKAEYNFDGSMLVILYSAEDKIDTIKVRNALRRTYKTRVEMRQIGPRDVAKELEGFGACGELRCCSTFLTDFSPISIKMAKAQGISLNPSEITGMCGRLRCCLLYEYQAYVEARKVLPKRNKRVGTPHGEGKVIDVLPLQDAVVVLIDDTRHVVQREDLIPMEEYEALKNGGCNGENCTCGKRGGEA
ncbi:MAG: regulatory iron-sulfur-containing complex subunit RicT [Anaerolineae bacterium]|nr:regulatory iron-sulfur-containing complex subunit RicT [Anaerolineae bacterium]